MSNQKNKKSMKVKIINYTISEEVHIKYESDYTNYVFSPECKKLTSVLLNIIRKGYDAEVTYEDYTPKALRDGEHLRSISHLDIPDEEIFAKGFNSQDI